MIDVRIVCTHDAVKLAETLMRLLVAEQHRVRLTYGRQALHALEDARATREAVLLIWSPDARSQTYMLEWARSMEASRLIELARGASDWPAIKRANGVIDFTPWRGDRGARAWKALTERLGAIERGYAPPKPPSAKVLTAVGLASAAAVTGIAVMRADTVEKDFATAPFEELALIDPAEGVGGPLRAIEPASIGDEETLMVRHYPELAPLETGSFTPLAPVVHFEPLELRDPTLLERLDALNPLRRSSEEPME